VIEGTPEMMWASLKKLRDLPGDTQVYLRPRIHAGQHQVRADHRAGQRGAEGPRRASGKQIADGQWTIPTTIDEEKAANPFLARRRAGGRRRRRPCRQPAAEVFTEIRARKE